MGKIRVVSKDPGKEPTVEVIDDGYEAMQTLVGGYFTPIEHIKFGGLMYLYVNEDGERLGLPQNLKVPNVGLRKDILLGTAVIAANTEDGDAVTLTNEQVDEAIKFLTRWAL